VQGWRHRDLIGIPPNLCDQEDILTRTLFDKCPGQSFVVVKVESIEGLPHPLAKLDGGHILGEEAWMLTIWVGPEYLQVESS
jgi:hypothetical protein